CRSSPPRPRVKTGGCSSRSSRSSPAPRHLCLTKVSCQVRAWAYSTRPRSTQWRFIISTSIETQEIRTLHVAIAFVGAALRGRPPPGQPHRVAPTPDPEEVYQSFVV